jgi:hypothetical protein
MYHFKTILCSEIAFINFVLKRVKAVVENIPLIIFQLIHYKRTIREIYCLAIQEGHNVIT